MRKTFKYRIYPTKSQATALESVLSECRWLYNHLLEQRKTAWEERKELLGLYDQQNTLPGLKAERPSLKLVHAQVLQNVGTRIDLAFKAFFRRCKSGETPGYPRFRNRFRYDSICFPQAPSGCKLSGSHVQISKVGHVKAVLHRPIEGTIKTATIKRTPTGKWFVSFSCEVEAKPLPANDLSVGIDMGLKTFAQLSNGESVSNPRFFKQEKKALAKVQRKFSKCEKDTPERRRCRKPVARVHERIKWKREDFAHKESRKIVDRFGTIIVEDLSTNDMLQKGTTALSRSIADAAWGNFLQMLEAKAGEAGRKFEKVNPAYTSQTCNACGYRQKMPLSVRVFECPNCEVHTDRDLNAALNILSVGSHALGIQSLEAPGFNRGE